MHNPRISAIGSSALPGIGDSSLLDRRIGEISPANGPDVMANAQLLCGHCNERKGVRTMPELWKMTRDKGLLVNQRQVELLYRERDAERMADEKLSKPGFRELWQLPEG